MEQIWERLYNAAKGAQNPREISERIYAGGVAAALESVSGRIYTGVCVDTSCTLCRISTIISAVSEAANEARHNGLLFWER